MGFASLYPSYELLILANVTFLQHSFLICGSLCFLHPDQEIADDGG
jgi:hypothetical protein